MTEPKVAAKGGAYFLIHVESDFFGVFFVREETHSPDSLSKHDLLPLQAVTNPSNKPSCVFTTCGRFDTANSVVFCSLAVFRGRRSRMCLCWDTWRTLVWGSLSVIWCFHTLLPRRAGVALRSYFMSLCGINIHRHSSFFFLLLWTVNHKCPLCFSSGPESNVSCSCSFKCSPTSVTLLMLVTKHWSRQHGINFNTIIQTWGRWPECSFALIWLQTEIDALHEKQKLKVDCWGFSGITSKLLHAASSFARSC